MKNEIVIGIIILFLGFGIFVFTNRPKEISPSSYQQTPVTSTETPAPTVPQSPATQTATTKSPTITTPTPTATVNSGITATEISKHTDANSCWMVINGNVYDVTKYITSHPGGDLILLGCGKDATDLYNGLTTSNHRHSSRAQSILAQLLVGPLTK